MRQRHHAALRLVVNNSSGTDNPRAAHSRNTRRWSLAGNALAAFQLDTAGGETSKTAAAAFVPPSASMISDTVMPTEYSSSVKASSGLNLESNRSGKSARMPQGNNGGSIWRMKLLEQRSPRSVKAISERLELTRKALDLSQAAFVKPARLQPTAYANWKKGIGRPDLDSAFALADAHGLTIEWIYEGDAGRLPGRIVEAIREYLGSGRAA